MDKPWLAKNKEWREKLQTFVREVTDEELQLVIYKEGWTIAVMLGHLAFWDLRRAALVKRWQRRELEPSDISGVSMDSTNDSLMTIYLAMPPRKVAELAVKAAEVIDKAIAELPDDVIPQIQAMNDRGALDRAYHRQMHLDEIETFLKAKRKN